MSAPPQQSIRLDILNADHQPGSQQRTVKLAKLARDFAQKNLDAENKKYELGTEINQNVFWRRTRWCRRNPTWSTNQIGLRRTCSTC